MPIISSSFFFPAPFNVSTLAVAQTQAVDNGMDERSDEIDPQDFDNLETQAVDNFKGQRSDDIEPQDMDNMETQAVDNFKGQRSDDIEPQDMDNMETQAVGMGVTVADMENAATVPFGSDDMETQIYDQDDSSSDTGIHALSFTVTKRTI